MLVLDAYLETLSRDEKEEFSRYLALEWADSHQMEQAIFADLKAGQRWEQIQASREISDSRLASYRKDLVKKLKNYLAILAVREGAEVDPQILELMLSRQSWNAFEKLFAKTERSLQASRERGPAFFHRYFDLLTLKQGWAAAGNLSKKRKQDSLGAIRFKSWEQAVMLEGLELLLHLFRIEDEPELAEYEAWLDFLIRIAAESEWDEIAQLFGNLIQAFRNKKWNQPFGDPIDDLMLQGFLRTAPMMESVTKGDLFLVLFNYYTKQARYLIEKEGKDNLLYLFEWGKQTPDLILPMNRQYYRTIFSVLVQKWLRASGQQAQKQIESEIMQFLEDGKRRLPAEERMQAFRLCMARFRFLKGDSNAPFQKELNQVISDPYYALGHQLLTIQAHYVNRHPDLLDAIHGMRVRLDATKPLPPSLKKAYKNTLLFIKRLEACKNLPRLMELKNILFQERPILISQWLFAQLQQKKKALE